MNARVQPASAWRPSTFLAVGVLGVASLLAAVPGWQDDLYGWILPASPLLLFDIVRLRWRGEGAQAARIGGALALLWLLPCVVVGLTSVKLCLDLRAEARAKPDDGRPRLAWRTIQSDPECTITYVYVDESAGESSTPHVAGTPLARLSGHWRPVMLSLYSHNDCR